MSTLRNQLGLVTTLTLTSMKSRYRKTFAGFIWVILNPLLMYAAQSLIFSFILKIQVKDYSLFLLTGLLPWIFITKSLEMGVPIFDDMRESLKNLNIHPFVFIASSVLDNFINFCLAFFILLIPMLLINPNVSLNLIFLPIPMLLMLITVNLTTFLFSLYNVFLRDIRYIISFIINIMFFLTPVFYPRTIIPANYQFLIDLNPFYILIEPFRYCILENCTSCLFYSILKGLALATILVLLVIKLWKSKKNNFYALL